MSTQPPEEIPDLPAATERLHEALAGFTGCIGEAVADICSYGLTIGTEYVPFRPDDDDDCDDADEFCSQVWVRVTGIQPKEVPNSFGPGDCATVLQIGLEVGVLRCFEIDENGEAPTATQTLEAALQSMTDMQAILCAANDCEVWESINTGGWTPYGPMGGQYGGMWTFTVEL